jgi:uncharacterized protein (DUF1684 family)
MHEHEHEHERGHGHEHERSEYVSLAARIAVDRAAKDAFFQSSAQSPIPLPARTSFVGLAYYPVDPAYRFESVRLVPLEDQRVPAFRLATSDGRQRRAERVGTLRFALHERPSTLTAYDLSDGLDGGLFVPFLDATSGSTTYGAGRYLDLERQPDGSYVLDFNLVYHPFCAYSPAYSCPLPPAENRLPVAIEAGERLPGAEVVARAGHRP